MSTARVRLAAVLTVCALLVGACGSANSGDAAPPATPAPLDDVASFALALGVDPLDEAAIERLGAYDLVVVDGGSTTPEQVAALHANGTKVLGYLSVGTVEPYRPWFDDAKEQGWLLDRWPDWDEWYVDTGAAGFRALIVDEARRELGAGFDGLFLDNTDMVSSHPDQRSGMTDLVGRLDTLVGDRLLFAQNGDTTVDDIASHLDGWNREDVSSTFDFDTDAYAAVSPEDHASASETLQRLADQGLFVTATDYTAGASDPMTTDAVDAACSIGAVPFVSDIDLTQVPAEPPTCP